MLCFWDQLCWNWGTVLFTAKTFCCMLQGILIYTPVLVCT